MPADGTPLAQWQKTLFEAVTRPLDSERQVDARWPDGRPARAVVSKLVKDQGKLDALERVGIYNRMYWTRTLNSLADDFPGLQALLGEAGFDALCRNYLTARPSRSHTLRDLGKALPDYVRTRRIQGFTTRSLVDLAAYEWAQIEAFDAAWLPPLAPEVLGRADAERLKVSLQPCLQFVEVRHAVGDFVARIKSDGTFRAAVSNSSLERRSRIPKTRTSALPQTEPRTLIVHRSEGRLYYKELPARGIRLLRALASGLAVADACEEAFRGDRASPQAQAVLIQEWFALWVRLGWLCPRKKTAAEE